MWATLSGFILRRRYWNLAVILLLTFFMAQKARNVQMSYEMTQMLPVHDTTSVIYEQFKQTFGEDGSVLFIGLQDTNLFELGEFNAWYELTEEIKKIDGVEGIVSISKLYYLKKNDSLRKFDFLPVFTKKPDSQTELDSLLNVVFSLPFYEDLLYNAETGFTMMAITLDRDILNTKERVDLIYQIRDAGNAFAEAHNLEMHFSGLPYIRTITAKK